MTPGRVLAVALGVGLALVLRQAVEAPVSERADTRPAETRIVRLLHSAIGLKPGATFRGSVVTFAGGDPTKPIDWFDQHAYDVRLKQETGNDHRLVGLWTYDIPTLGEYSHYITPPMYLVFSRLLARPIDRQMRNIMALTRPDAALLRAFGVRFVISDATLGPEYRVRDVLNLGTNRSLYLYELPAPNLGNYSPTRIVLVRDAAGALGALKRGADLQHEAVTTEPVQFDLTPATSADLTFVKGGFRLRAESAGTSLLVLPGQFSRCLRLSGARGTEAARLLRVNLLQLGVLFSARVDAQISFRTGPFGQARCRLRDIEDMKALNLTDAARIFPLRASNHLSSAR